MPQERIGGENYDKFLVQTAPGTRLPVDIGADSLGDGLEIKNDVGAPIFTGVAVRTPTTTRVPSSSSSALILSANANRKGFSISNISTSKLYLSFVNPASVANCFIEVPAGAFLLLDQQLMVGNAIYGIWAAADGAAQVTEYV